MENEQMIVRDLTQDQIVIGMKIRSLKNSALLGTIVKIDHPDDHYAWVLWDGNDSPTGGFYDTDCKCEVVSFGPSDLEEREKLISFYETEWIRYQQIQEDYINKLRTSYRNNN